MHTNTRDRRKELHKTRTITKSTVSENFTGVPTTGILIVRNGSYTKVDYVEKENGSQTEPKLGSVGEVVANLMALLGADITYKSVSEVKTVA